MITDKEYIYIKDTILKPYLVHVEFELENLISKIETDKTLQSIIHKKGFNTTYLKKNMKIGLIAIEHLINILNT